jgi:formylglycine-generating enzyme required for sulfatase activity
LSLVEGGRFSVGSPDGDSENPQRDVELGPFLLGEREVTNGEYARFVEEEGREAPPHWGGPKPPAELLDHPVTFVSAGDASAYCAWLSAQTGKKYRLPRAAEWEVAAGFDGEKNRKYPWGDEFDETKANLKGGRTLAVGTHEGDVSPAGVRDLAGNVCEWTTASSEGASFVVYGGCCDDKGRERAARCAFRQVLPEGMRSPFLGFRVARELE